MSHTLPFVVLSFFLAFSEVWCRLPPRCYSNHDCPSRTCCFLRKGIGRPAYGHAGSEWDFRLNTCVPDSGTNQACYVNGCPRCKYLPGGSQNLRCVSVGVYDPPYGYRGRCRLPKWYSGGK